MNIQSIFAINMRKYRKAAHLTQEDLAEKSGLHRTYIGGIEQRRINVSLRNIEKIASALDVDPALLFVRTLSQAGDDDLNNASTGNAVLSKGDYALCMWTDQGIELTPISVKNRELSIQILCSLIDEGHDADLAEAYEKAQDQLLSYFRESRQ